MGRSGASDPLCIQSLLVMLGMGVLLSCGGASSGSHTSTPPPAQGGIPVTFFGIHVNRIDAPWPVVSVGAQRLHDNGVNWAEIETQPGVYDFTRLDTLMARAQTKGVDLLYTFVDVPQFYSSVPTDTDCAYPQNGTGGCDPPSDLNSDGTGANTNFKNFVTALATHATKTAPSITYWEIWNEPDGPKMWKGTPQQLVRMARDAACIIKGIGSGCTAAALDPNAKIVTPAPTGGPNEAPQWMGTYLAAGGAQYADVISFHGYVQCPSTTDCPATPTPEVVAAAASNMKNVLAINAQSAKPIFDTEGSWGPTDVDLFNDPDQRSAFVARFLVLQQSAGIERVYWYRWDVGGGGGWGTLWDSVNTNVDGCNNAGTPYPAGGFLCKPGTAYEQVYNWLVGATLNTPCAANGTVWTCGYTRANGYQAQIVWDASQNCIAGLCSTSSFTAGTQFKQYRDLSGNTSAISGPVPIGAKPVILESGNP